MNPFIFFVAVSSFGLVLVFTIVFVQKDPPSGGGQHVILGPSPATLSPTLYPTFARILAFPVYNSPNVSGNFTLIESTVGISPDDYLASDAYHCISDFRWSEQSGLFTVLVNSLNAQGYKKHLFGFNGAPTPSYTFTDDSVISTHSTYGVLQNVRSTPYVPYLESKFYISDLLGYTTSTYVNCPACGEPLWYLNNGSLMNYSHVYANGVSLGLYILTITTFENSTNDDYFLMSFPFSMTIFDAHTPSKIVSPLNNVVYRLVSNPTPNPYNLSAYRRDVTTPIWYVEVPSHSCVLLGTNTTGYYFDYVIFQNAFCYNLQEVQYPVASFYLTATIKTSGINITYNGSLISQAIPANANEYFNITYFNFESATSLREYEFNFSYPSDVPTQSSRVKCSTVQSEYLCYSLAGNFTDSTPFNPYTGITPVANTFTISVFTDVNSLMYNSPTALWSHRIKFICASSVFRSNEISVSESGYVAFAISMDSPTLSCTVELDHTAWFTTSNTQNSRTYSVAFMFNPNGTVVGYHQFTSLMNPTHVPSGTQGGTIPIFVQWHDSPEVLLVAFSPGVAGIGPMEIHDFSNPAVTRLTLSKYAIGSVYAWNTDGVLVDFDPTKLYYVN